MVSVTRKFKLRNHSCMETEYQLTSMHILVKIEQLTNECLL